MADPNWASRIRCLLDAGDLASLFRRELGWNNPPDGAASVDLEDTEEDPSEPLSARGVAKLRGVMVWVVDCSEIPAPARQRRITRQLHQWSSDHLLVFADGRQQRWLWPEQRPSGTGWRLVDHTYYRGQPNTDLLQRLEGVRFGIKDRKSLTGPKVLERVRRSFNVDKVTKRFYDKFRKYHRLLTDRIEGMPDRLDRDRRWYASLLLNRLMFIYFIQRQGFLNSDRSYLQTSLRKVREVYGPDRFYAFFRQFLLPLFHEGLGAPPAQRAFDDPRVADIIGDVPYVDGGIFERHDIENSYDIEIPDSAFKEIFGFFDQWRWHLDERPTGDQNEINPDILGFIFEQYVNFTDEGQKEKGAYYTKPDVTGYMTTYTIIPAVVDRLVDAGLENPCVLLPDSKDRYLHDALGFGLDSEMPEGELPPSDYPDEENLHLALPGERWCDVTHRRQRYGDLVAEVDSGRITTADEAITANLDIAGLMEDYLSRLSADECSIAFEVLRDLKVCDPTCGSGAFLLAALDVLDPMYTAVFERAQEISEVGDGPRFLHEAASHPNERYWLLKTTCLNNLFGLDIMGEAVEIARLRMFLKLVAQLDKVSEIEPLPDLDFNIKAGNLLVGIADTEDARRRFGASLLALEGLSVAEEAANQAAAAYSRYTLAQASGVADEQARGKRRLATQIRTATDTADLALHKMRSEPLPFETWKESHQPFHWFAEFPSVWQQGGFDVVVGNPPYIAKKTIRDYSWVGYETQKCADLYAVCLERAARMVNRAGRIAMIVPHSLCFSRNYTTLRAHLTKELASIWVSSYDRRPAGLFPPNVNVRNTIFVASRQGVPRLATSRCRRSPAASRPHLFATQQYVQPPDELLRCGEAPKWPFVDDLLLAGTFGRMVTHLSAIGRRKTGEHKLGFKELAYSWLPVFVDAPPTLDPETGLPARSTSGVHWFMFERQEHRDLALLVLAGRWGYLWWLIYGDLFHATPGVLSAMPCAIERLASVTQTRRLLLLAEDLKSEMPKTLDWQLNKLKVGRYNMAKLRHITDDADWLLAQAWGLSREPYEAAGNLRDRMIFGNKG